MHSFCILSDHYFLTIYFRTHSVIVNNGPLSVFLLWKAWKRNPLSFLSEWVDWLYQIHWLHPRKSPFSNVFQAMLFAAILVQAVDARCSSWYSVARQRGCNSPSLIWKCIVRWPASSVRTALCTNRRGPGRGRRRRRRQLRPVFSSQGACLTPAVPPCTTASPFLFLFTKF